MRHRPPLSSAARRTGAPARAGARAGAGSALASRVSGAPDRASAQVLGIVLESGDKLIITKEVELHPGSGGVHRAHNANAFAWADSGGAIRPPRSICSPCVMRIETP